MKPLPPIQLETFSGRRKRSLPGWDRSMCRPLLFDAELAAEEAGSSFPAHLVPIAVFFKDDRCEQLAGDWAFIAIDGAQQVFLVDDEGARALGEALAAFVATLEEP